MRILLVRFFFPFSSNQSDERRRPWEISNVTARPSNRFVACVISLVNCAQPFFHLLPPSTTMKIASCLKIHNKTNNQRGEGNWLRKKEKTCKSYYISPGDGWAVERGAFSIDKNSIKRPGVKIVFEKQQHKRWRISFDVVFFPPISRQKSEIKKICLTLFLLLLLLFVCVCVCVFLLNLLVYWIFRLSARR